MIPEVERVVLSPGQYEVVVGPAGLVGKGFIHMTPTEAARYGAHFVDYKKSEAEADYGRALLDAAEPPDLCACGGYIAGIGERCQACEGERFDRDEIARRLV